MLGLSLSCKLLHYNLSLIKKKILFCLEQAFVLKKSKFPSLFTYIDKQRDNINEVTCKSYPTQQSSLTLSALLQPSKLKEHKRG